MRTRLFLISSASRDIDILAHWRAPSPTTLAGEITVSAAHCGGFGALTLRDCSVTLGNGRGGSVDCSTQFPGSHGEHQLQRLHASEERAQRFYRQQVLDHLNDEMREFVARQEMLFVATSDAGGEADCSFRAGPPGFIQVLDERTICYPEYRGNGVMASLGNICENGHIGLLMIDFFRDVIGLHVNGTAQVFSD